MKSNNYFRLSMNYIGIRGLLKAILVIYAEEPTLCGDVDVYRRMYCLIAVTKDSQIRMLWSKQLY